MKYTIIFTVLVLLFPGTERTFGQNGKITNRAPYDILQQEDIREIIYFENKKTYSLKPEYDYLEKVRIEKITYLSDGLKITGYLAYPEAKGKYPAIIYNRGGNREFGSINNFKIAFILAKVASWGYVVIGSQYRGTDGGEGMEEFGGRDVNDVLNLIPALDNLSFADTKKPGIYGWSRGGMMTYLTLMKTNKFKAAVVGGGLSDLFKMKETRPEMEEVYEELIPGYANNKEETLIVRSAIRQVDKINKTTPILVLHGTADWRVVPQMAIDLSEQFLRTKIPFRLVLLEGGDHGLTEHVKEVNRLTKEWFDKYLKNDSPLPDLIPHGK